MNIAQVGEHMVCRPHVLVEVIEVGEQQLPPAVKVVEGLVDTRTLGEALMEFTDEEYGVGNFQLRVAAEEVADGDIRRAPQWSASLTGEVVVEE